MIDITLLCQACGNDNPITLTNSNHSRQKRRSIYESIEIKQYPP